MSNPEPAEAGSTTGPLGMLWVELLSSRWRSLAVVPATGASDGLSLARGLTEVGTAYLGREVELLDARGLELRQARALVERLEAASGAYQLVLALDSPLASEAALLAARRTDALLLQVPLGQAHLGEVRTLLERVGRERFVGAVTLDGTPG